MGKLIEQKLNTIIFVNMRVYLANQEGTELYKIGVTKKDPEIRLKQLQTGNPVKLKLVESFETQFDYKLESALHKYFVTENIQDEWFELSPEMVADFINQCEKFEKAFKMFKDYDNPFI